MGKTSILGRAAIVFSVETFDLRRVKETMPHYKIDCTIMKATILTFGVLFLPMFALISSCDSTKKDAVNDQPKDRSGEIVKLNENDFIYPSDPIDSVAGKFIYYDKFLKGGSFTIEEPGIDAWFKSNHHAVSGEYLSQILQRYSLSFYNETLIKCYLHRAGDEEPLAEVIARKSDLSEDDRKWLEFLLQHSLGNN